MVCTAWYVEAPLQRGFGERAEWKALTLLIDICFVQVYYNLSLGVFQDEIRLWIDFVRIHKMPTQNLYDSITLAENIKIQAKARNVQLKDMFAELDLSKGTLSNLRLGKKISADSLARIADYLDCSMDFLMGRTVDPAVKRMNLTDDEHQKVTDYLQFILSQRK